MSLYTNTLIGKTIEYYRKKNILSTNYIQSILVVSQPTYSRLIKGRSSLKVSQLLAFCEAVKVKPETFINRMNKIEPRYARKIS